MKRILPLIALLISFDLSAQVYQSNALGMALEKKEAMEERGYELLVSPSEEILYLDGILVERKIFLDDGFETERDGESVRYVLDDENRIIEEHRENEVRRNYYSDEGLLLSSVLSSGDEIIDISSYYYDTSSRLIRVDKLSSSYVFSSPLLYYQIGDVEYKAIEDFSFNGDEIVENDDGSVSVVENDGVRRTYSGDGKLLREENDGLLIEYDYDEEGELSATRESHSSSLIIRRFRGGELYEIEYYDDGILLKDTSYSSQAIDERRYRDGKAYAVIHYDMDGRTIKGIKML